MSISATRDETPSARSLVLDVPSWSGHIAGQHVDVRLTAPDGYQATRSYSLSSAPDEPPQITVERVDDGEVSTYLVDVAEPGDFLEVRGPLGGYFVWKSSDRPLFLVAGGSGVAPLRSMWRVGAVRMRLLYSARTVERVIFGDELASTAGLDVAIHLTRETRDGYRSGRIDHEALETALDGMERPAIYVCGPTAFVESVADDMSALLGSGLTMKTERFG